MKKHKEILVWCQNSMYCVAEREYFKASMLTG